MKRRLLNLLTLLSLLLCVAVIALWVCSHRGAEHVDVGRRWVSGEREVRSWRVSWASGGGGASLTVVRSTRNYSEEVAWWVLAPKLGTPVRVSYRRHGPGAYPEWSGSPWPIRAAGFGLGSTVTGTPAGMRGRYSEAAWGVVVPYWAACALAAAVPALRVANAARRLRRRQPGICPRCGYDLRATPGRCPECGTAAAVSTTA
jgi:hypothetical protein